MSLASIFLSSSLIISFASSLGVPFSSGFFSSGFFSTIFSSGFFSTIFSSGTITGSASCQTFIAFMFAFTDSKMISLDIIY
jgi:hypothetical protein